MCQGVANAQINAETFQQHSTDKGPHETGEYVLEEPRPANNPACEPACHNTHADLGGNGTFVQNGERLVIDADADRRPKACWRCWLPLGSRPPLIAVLRLCHVVDMEGRSETIQVQRLVIQFENECCLQVITSGFGHRHLSDKN
jgi:hypothetical protein